MCEAQNRKGSRENLKKKKRKWRRETKKGEEGANKCREKEKKKL
jgi:hypothetical protein